MLPGIVGTIQATEVVKILLGLGETLSGRLLTFDTLSMSFRPLKIFRDPDCPIEHGGEPASEEQAQKRTVAAG